MFLLGHSMAHLLSMSYRLDIVDRSVSVAFDPWTTLLEAMLLTSFRWRKPRDGDFFERRGGEEGNWLGSAEHLNRGSWYDH